MPGPNAHLQGQNSRNLWGVWQVPPPFRAENSEMLRKTQAEGTEGKLLQGDLEG